MTPATVRDRAGDLVRLAARVDAACNKGPKVVAERLVTLRTETENLLVEVCGGSPTSTSLFRAALMACERHGIEPRDMRASVTPGAPPMEVFTHSWEAWLALDGPRVMHRVPSVRDGYPHSYLLYVDVDGVRFIAGGPAEKLRAAGIPFEPAFGAAP